MFTYQTSGYGLAKILLAEPNSIANNSLKMFDLHTHMVRLFLSVCCLTSTSSKTYQLPQLSVNVSVKEAIVFIKIVVHTKNTLLFYLLNIKIIPSTITL